MERKELQDIKIKAHESYDNGENPVWIRAYIALADAADRLDAMMARTEVKDITNG